MLDEKTRKQQLEAVVALLGPEDMYAPDHDIYKITLSATDFIEIYTFEQNPIAEASLILERLESKFLRYLELKRIELGRLELEGQKSEKK